MDQGVEVREHLGSPKILSADLDLGPPELIRPIDLRLPKKTGQISALHANLGCKDLSKRWGRVNACILLSHSLFLYLFLFLLKVFNTFEYDSRSPLGRSYKD